MKLLRKFWDSPLEWFIEKQDGFVASISPTRLGRKMHTLKLARAQSS